VAHDGELAEVGRLGVDVRTDVEQDGVAFRARYDSGQGRAADAVDGADDLVRGGHGRAGVSRGDHGRGFSLGDEVGADTDGRIALPAQRRQSVVRHVDDFAGIDDLDPRRDGAAELLAQDFFAPDEQDLDRRILLGREDGTLDDLVRRMVPAHRIERDPATRHVRRRLQRFLDGDDFAALVVAALRADAVRLLRFLALRAGGERRQLEKVVRAARVGSRLRMAAFWIRHGVKLLFFESCTAFLIVLLFLQLFPQVLQRAPPLVDDRAVA
jgi:hypothetical protein